MRPPLLLTGPPAAGKSTTARALAESASLAAVVDVDDLRHLVVAGHAAPWEGAAGRRQQQLGVSNACDLARRFHAAGIEVVLADVVTPATAEQYRQLLPDLRIVRLRLPVAVARRRARTRPVHLRDDEFDRLHVLDGEATFPVDHLVDVGELDPAQQTDVIRALWSAAGPPPGPATS